MLTRGSDQCKDGVEIWIGKKETILRDLPFSFVVNNTIK